MVCLTPYEGRMSKTLQAWERAYSPEFYAQLPRNWERRGFLFGAGKAATAAALAPLLLQLGACKRQEAAQGGQDSLSQHPWPIFAAVHDILFPADGNGPSARDIQATQYLQLLLQTPDFDAQERKFMLEGVAWLDQYAQEQHKSAFLALTAPQRDAVLRAIAVSSAGDRWLNGLLNYVLEALLCDPVYGGNPQGVGWQWLQHQPGFPRPTQPYFQQAKL
jgi:gluconate 2-dehydrogenase gamma chain